MESTTNSGIENAEQSVDATASSVGIPIVNEQPSGSIEIETDVSNSQPAIVNTQPTIGTAKKYPERHRRPPDRYHGTKF